MNTPVDLVFTLHVALQDNDGPMEWRIEVPGLIPLSVLDEFLLSALPFEVFGESRFRFGDETIEEEAEADPWLQDKVSAGDAFAWMYDRDENEGCDLRVESVRAEPGRAWEPVYIASPADMVEDVYYLKYLQSERFNLPFKGELYEFLESGIVWSSRKLPSILIQAERWSPVLTEFLRRIAEEPFDYIRCEAYTFPTAVLLLLAGMRASPAAEPLRKLAALKEVLRNELFAPLAETDPAEGWGRILATLHIDDPDALIRFVQQDGLSSDIREASLTALGMLLRENRISLPELEAGLGVTSREIEETDLEMIHDVADDLIQILGPPYEDSEPDYLPRAAPPIPLTGYVRNGTYLTPLLREQPKVGRNDPCPCGSGKKYKKCCGG